MSPPPTEKSTLRLCLIYVQGDQLYMVVCFWYLVTRDLSSVRYSNVASLFTRYQNHRIRIRYLDWDPDPLFRLGSGSVI